MYNRTQRLVVEGIALVFAIVTLGVALKYAHVVRYETPFGAFAPKDEPRKQHAQSAVYAIYGVPPVLSILISLASIAAYLFTKVPLIAPIITSSIMIVGLCMVAMVWGDCGVNAIDNYDGYNFGQYCYESWLNPDVMSMGWIAGLLTLVSLHLVTYVVQLVFAARDYHRFRLLGKPGTYKTVNELDAFRTLTVDVI